MVNKIKSIIAGVLNVTPEQITENTSTQNLESWDSLNHMNIVLAVEEEFDITFDDDELTQLTSVKKLSDAVVKRKVQ